MAKMQERHTQPRREMHPGKIRYEGWLKHAEISSSDCREVAEISKTIAKDREKMVETRNKMINDDGEERICCSALHINDRNEIVQSF